MYTTSGYSLRTMEMNTVSFYAILKKKKCVKFRTKLTHFEFFFQTLIALNFGPNQRFFKVRYECKSTFFLHHVTFVVIGEKPKSPWTIRFMIRLIRRLRN